MNRPEYKEAMKQLDKNIRICVKYLEGLIEERFRAILKVKQPPIPKAPKVDLSRLESKDDSLQKQINGLKSKVEIAQNHIQKHHEQEIFLKRMSTRTEEVLNQITMLFEELYDSGYYSEGTKRKIRAEGLIKRKNDA